MSALRFSTLVTSLSLFCVAGCAGSSSETARQLERMQERIAILQNERDRLDERVTALEQHQEDAQAATTAQTKGNAANQRPSLRVVTLQPETEEAEPKEHEPSAAAVANSAADDGAEHVLISGTGDRLTATVVEGTK
ncbi:MAG TPA: hypothetical protein VHM70_32510 [Polyangiaceae bacterium]|nr:hypothetical protein [Polyangiaceae bacterium]